MQAELLRMPRSQVQRGTPIHFGAAGIERHGMRKTI